MVSKTQRSKKLPHVPREDTLYGLREEFDRAGVTEMLFGLHETQQDFYPNCCGYISKEQITFIQVYELFPLCCHNPVAFFSNIIKQF